MPLTGLTGLSLRVDYDDRTLLARRQPAQPLPLVDRRREFRLLRKLSRSGLVARPLAVNARWLLLPWQPGEPVTAETLAARQPELVALLRQVHQQPLTGYRLRLLPLLHRYWQLCRQRQIGWQRALRRLTKQGEPHPLRLAPLHMDVHAGNLLTTPHGLRLIDWEYAADGDVALELAALCCGETLHAEALLSAYAQQAGLALPTLQRQIRRWQPWLRLLTASWYQLRAEQSGDATLAAAADDAWQQLTY